MKNLIALLLLGFIGSVQCLNSVDGSNEIKHLGVIYGKDGEDSRELNEDEHGRARDLVFGKGPENMAFYKTKLGGKKTNNRNAKNKRKRKGSCPNCGRNNGSNKKPAQQSRKKTNKKQKNRPSTPPKKTSKKRPVNRPASKTKPAGSGTKNSNKKSAREKNPSKKKGLNMSGRGVTGRTNNGKKSNKNTREGSVRGSKVW